MAVREFFSSLDRAKGALLPVLAAMINTGIAGRGTGTAPAQAEQRNDAKAPSCEADAHGSVACKKDESTIQDGGIVGSESQHQKDTAPSVEDTGGDKKGRD